MTGSLQWLFGSSCIAVFSAISLAESDVYILRTIRVLEWDGENYISTCYVLACCNRGVSFQSVCIANCDNPLYSVILLRHKKEKRVSNCTVSVPAHKHSFWSTRYICVCLVPHCGQTDACANRGYRLFLQLYKQRGMDGRPLSALLARAAEWLYACALTCTICRTCMYNNMLSVLSTHILTSFILLYRTNSTLTSTVSYNIIASWY